MEKEFQKEVSEVSDTEMVKNEIANKNSLDITTTDSVAVANRLKAIDVLGVAIKNSLIEGINEDYAVIPNTSKPALLLPGARKICMLYGLTAQYPVMDIKETLVLTKCELFLNGMKVSESYGSCAIGKQRDLGWEQNKAIKIAQKRAMVGATLQIANLSKLFTQDTEDMTPVKQYTDAEKKNTFAVCDAWKQLKQIKCFGKAQFKQAWLDFCRDVKDIMGLDSPYELGCDKALAEKFLKEMKKPRIVKDEVGNERLVGAFPGELEEVAVFNSPITDEQIANYGKDKK